MSNVISLQIGPHLVELRSLCKASRRSLIIVQTKSPVHRHDIRLCKIMDLHQQFVKHYTSGGAPFTPQDAYPFLRAPNIEMSLRECLEVRPDDITDLRIRDIIARWKGLRELQRPYLSKDFEPTEQNYLNPWNQGPAQIGSQYLG
jgi:hypothetical protein